MIFSVVKSLKNRRAVVIGGSVCGVAAAIALGARGARVVVLDPGPAPLQELLDSSHAQGMGLGLAAGLTHPSLLAELFASTGHRLTDFLTLAREQHVACILGPKGPVHSLPAEREILAGDPALAGGKPEQLRAFESFMRRIGIAQEGIEAWLRSRAEGEIPGVAALRGLPALANWRRPGDQLDRLAPPLADLTGGLFALAGISPAERGAGYWRWLGELMLQGGWRVEEGPEGMRNALLRIAELAGVRFATHCQEIRVDEEGGRVRRVSGSGFKDVPASILVVAPGYPAPAGLPIVPLKEGAKPPLPVVPKLALMRVEVQRPDAEPLPPLPCRVCLLGGTSMADELRALHSWRVPAQSPSMAIVKSIGGERLTVQSLVPAPNESWEWSDAQRVAEERRILNRLEEVAPLDSVRLEITGPVRLIPLRESSLPGLSSLRVRPKANTLAGYYDAAEWHPGGISFSGDLLAGVAVGVRASFDARRTD